MTDLTPHQPTSVTAARFPTEYGQTDESVAEVLEWDAVSERIAAAKNYILATTTPDGRPYQRPVDGVLVAGVVCFGGSPETRWVRFLQQRPAVSLTLPDDDYAVIIEGTGVQIVDAEDPLTVAMGPVNRAKYPQYFTSDEPEPFHPFWTVRANRVFAWSLSEFPAKATRFDF